MKQYRISIEGQVFIVRKFKSTIFKEKYMLLRDDLEFTSIYLCDDEIESGLIDPKFIKSKKELEEHLPLYKEALKRAKKYSVLV